MLRLQRHTIPFCLTFVAGVALVALVPLTMAQAPVTKEAPTADDQETEEIVPKRLFEQNAFDLIRLNDGSEIKVEPLNLKGRTLPDNPRPGNKLVVRTLDDPDTEYEVIWRDIAEVKLFEQLILEEAETLVAAGDFNEAYDYYAYLDRYHSKMPGLAESLDKYLFEEAKSAQREAKYDQALSLLNEIHGRNPEFNGLGQAIDAAGGKLIAEKIERQDFAAARRLVESLSSKFPESAAATEWKGRIEQEARTRLTAAQDDLAAKRYRQAAEGAQAAMRIWPLAEARQMWTEAHRLFPRVVVGVTLPGGRTETNAMVDWAARRSARLFNRNLLEFQGYGPQGGVYQCPVGGIERRDLGKRLAITLRPNIPWSKGGGVLTGHDVARRLLVMCDPEHPAYRADWAELFAGVSVPDVYGVDIDLRRSHVHPDGMLQTILRPWNAASNDDLQAASVGPYVVDSVSDDEVRYLSNEQYFATSSTQPKEIIERYYPESRKAAAALAQGNIAVLDRVLPWDVPNLREAKNVVVEPYAAPTIQCLLTNQQKPFLAQRTFRRALLYAINRQQILRDQLGRGSAVKGQVISGPFPRGSGIDDPLGYAYNEEVPLREWNPYLARTLVNVARFELAKPARSSAAASKAEAGVADASKGAADNSKAPTAPAKPELPPAPSLVLAHPPHDVARVACRAIASQLKLIGLTVTLTETDAQSPATCNEDWDLLFVELAMWEPIIDARRLLGAEGIAGHASPYMEQALRDLELSDNWKSARQRLLEVHRIANQDLDVLPLWQITDHFAYRKGLQGVGKEPTLLYQNIELWQSPPWFSEDGQ